MSSRAYDRRSLVVELAHSAANRQAAEMRSGLGTKRSWRQAQAGMAPTGSGRPEAGPVDPKSTWRQTQVDVLPNPKPPFAVTQAIVLLAFIALGVWAAVRFRPEAEARA
jgi:hypothetical protein